MSRILLVLIAVLALAGTAVWLATPARTGRGAHATETTPATAETVREAPVLAPAPAMPPAEGPPAAVEPAAPASAARREAATPKDAELAGAQWVDGRVLFPAGTPDDEELFVIAKGKDFADGSDHRVAVARDGSFRVAFSAKTRSGRFELEARYLYLDELARWKSSESDGTVVLAPLLGTRIAGRVRLPPGTDAAGAGGRLEIEVTRRSGNSFDDETVSQHELSQGLEFAFDALTPASDPDRSYEVSYDGEVLLGKSGKLLPEAGKTLALELELRPGLVLSGSVRDEGRAPLAGAELMASVQSSPGSWNRSNWRTTESEADGSFRLGALAGGEVELRCELQGYEPLERQLGKLEEGQDVRDIALVMTRGSAISGVVRWPDGTPAEATLVLVPHRTSPEWSPEQGEVGGASDAGGAFSISGLSQESYRVTARATKTEEVVEKSAITGKERTKKRRTQWSAEIDPVEVGTQSLVLTLSLGLTVSGRVLDDLGTPLADFGVVAGRLEDGPGSSDWDGDLSRSFRDTDGSFRLEGFAPGEWELWGWSKDHAQSEPVRVTLPAAGPVELVVPREAAVNGRVLDPSGASFPRAALEAKRDSRRSRPFSIDDEATADAQGFFEIHGLGPGSMVLQAHGSTFAPSEPQTVEVRAGETITGLVLRLRPGGTLLGELLGADGLPQAGRMVSISDQRGFYENPTTEPDGRFRASGVPPGEIFVRAETLEGIQLRQSVTLAEGETVRMRLAPPGSVVRVYGHVRAAGEPLAGARVFAIQSGEPGRLSGGGSSSSSSSSSSRTGEDGAYEIRLPGTGRYWLSIQGDGETALSWRVTLDVPAVEALAFDVSIPVGRISGRVTDTLGQALAGVLVQSQPERHEGGAHGSARVLTDAEGRYELRVPAGQHAVSAGGARNSWFQHAGQAYAESGVGNLSVSENGHVRGIDLVLTRGGTLAGVARNADGSSAPRVEVWSEEAGAPGWSDENGRFEITGLAPGTHHVRARSRKGATREPVVVQITAGETRQVELELVAGTRVHLTVRENGALVGSDIRVQDERGRHQRVESGENGQAWLGPLVPGRYTVRAQRDGKQVEREFEVTAGQEESELELVFE